MSQNSVNIEEADICKCGRQFFGCKASKKTARCCYFRWIDLSPENADESSRFVSWNRFIDGENLIDRLKRKVKKLEEERDSLKVKLNENEKKMMALNKKLKEVKLQRD
ncbi:hypothetical protein KY284_026249 [Solanum tuberosum]|nr:hypothetical protein KY284_026249 [Solanum tuberosum]